MISDTVGTILTLFLQMYYSVQEHLIEFGLYKHNASKKPEISTVSYQQSIDI
jgi:hypothetical protein